MLKKGFIALTLLGLVLFFLPFFGLEPGFVNLGLGFLAISFGTVGTIIAISYENWVEYRNSEVKSAWSVWLGPPLPLQQIGFSALTLLGAVLFFGGWFLPVAGFQIGGNTYTWLGMFLLFFGVGGWFVASLMFGLVSWVAHRKRAGKEKPSNTPRSVVPIRRSVKDYALAMAPIGVFIIVALFSTGVIGRPPDGPYEEFHENGQLAFRTTYKDGERHGPFESYFENGQLRFRTNYDSGEWMRVDGREEWYFPDGRLMSTGIYNMGERCGEWILDKDQSVSPSDVITNFGEEFLTLLYDPCPPDLEDGN